MSKYNLNSSSRAVALKYDGSDVAPIVVASGMGHMAEKIVETAVENNVPVFEDNSLATILSRLELGQEIPEELFKMVVDIYVYFLNFSLKMKGDEAEKGTAAEEGPREVEAPETQ